AVQRQLARRVWRAPGNVEASVGELIGFSAPMQAVFASIRRFASDESPVLVTGLTGTGKELAAQALHALSPRSGRPLTIYRCCGVSEAVAEADLFGDPRKSADSFGPRKDLRLEARRRRDGGIWESARGGALLLDEI